MKTITKIGALALLPLLSGCFGCSQTLSVERDGTVRFVTEMMVQTDMMALAFEGEDQSEFCPTDEDTAPDVPPTVTMTAEQFVRDLDTVCRITAVGPLDDLVTALEAGYLTPGGTDEDAPQTTLVDEGNGVYTFIVHLASQGSDEANPEEAGMMAMMAPMFEGRTLVWSVTAPRILEVNDSDYVTRDGNTVTLTVPALEMITGVGIDYDLNVRFGL